jgi:hypothetical protein
MKTPTLLLATSMLAFGLLAAIPSASAHVDVCGKGVDPGFVHVVVGGGVCSHSLSPTYACVGTDDPLPAAGVTVSTDNGVQDISQCPGGA